MIQLASYILLGPNYHTEKFLSSRYSHINNAQADCIFTKGF